MTNTPCPEKEQRTPGKAGNMEEGGEKKKWCAEMRGKRRGNVCV